jgi:hypothetical protein
MDHHLVVTTHYHPHGDAGDAWQAVCSCGWVSPRTEGDFAARALQTLHAALSEAEALARHARRMAPYHDEDQAGTL